MGFFGPGAIIACVTIGSGETVFASRGGAIYGYTMLWCFVLGALCKGFQIYSGSRFITLTARGPLQSWMDIPGPRGWFVLAITVMTCFCMPFWLAGLPKMLGDFSNWMIDIPNPAVDPEIAKLPEAQRNALAAEYASYGRLWGSFYIGVAIAVTWMQTYGFLEKLQTAIVALLLVCMVAAAVISSPDLSAMFSGLFIPRMPDYEAWVVQKIPEMKGTPPWVELMVYLGVIGGGAQDYFGYIGMLREKAWGMLGRKNHSQVGPPPRILEAPDNIRRAKAWLRAPQIDVGVATVAILIFTVCFVVLGATVLHPNQEVPNGTELLTMQADFLVPLAGESPALRGIVEWTYKTGIFFAFFGTILGACEIFTRTVRECLIALWPSAENVPLRKIRAWVLLYAGGGGLVLLWTLDAQTNPVEFVKPAALISSGLVCGLWCFAMIWSDRVHLPLCLRMRWPLKICVILSGLVLTIGSIIGLVEYFRGLDLVGRGLGLVDFFRGLFEK